MAKIFKVSGYLVDTDVDFEAYQIAEWFEYNEFGLIPQHIHVEQSDIGKWDSENPLNYDNCDLAECEKYFKNEVPVLNGRSVKPGQVYRHFKGEMVKILHVGQDTESPGFFHVIYECSNGVWCRPYGMFVSEVDHKKYPNVKQKYRFELVEE